jgi:hypothetical protein
MVRRKSPAQGSDPEQVSSDVDDSVGEHGSDPCTSTRCSSAASKGRIFISPSSPTVNVNDQKVKSVPRGNLTSNGAMVFLDRSRALPLPGSPLSTSHR